MSDNRPKCPICRKIAEKEYHPFCTKRCADVDLNRWLNGSYTIASTEDESILPDEERTVS